MKVAFLANTGWYLNNFRRGTVNSLVKKGVHVTLICPASSGEDLISDLPCNLRTFKMDNAGTNLLSESRSFLGIYSILMDERPSLIFSFNPKTNLYGLLSCRLLGIPCVPNVSGVGNASQLEGWKAFLYKIFSKLAYRSAKHVFFQNNNDLAAYKGLGVLRADRYSCLPGSGVDVSRFQPSNVSAAQPFVFLLACRLITQKGVLTYLEAAEKLQGRTDKCEFWLAGVPDDSKRAVPEAVITEYEKRGVIRFLGNVKNMEEVLAKVRCVVLPSWYPEGVPRILLEGAAAGKPLITTDRPGCQDVVADGSNGFFVEAESAESLAEAMWKISELSAEELEGMGIASRVLAEEVFDERLVIREYLDLAEEFSLQT